MSPGHPMGAVKWQRACIVLMAVAPFLAYRLVRETSPAWLIGGFASLQAAAVAAMVFAGRSGRTRLLIASGVFVLVIGAILASGVSAEAIAWIAGGACHAVVYLGLLCWFSASLLPEREPLVTTMARRVRRTMPDRVVRYTRYVTVAWCVFFAAQLLASATLLLMAPEAVWSAFVTWCNVPLVAVMALGEFGVRFVLFRHEPRTSLLDTIAAMRHPAGITGHRP